MDSRYKIGSAGQHHPADAPMPARLPKSHAVMAPTTAVRTVGCCCGSAPLCPRRSSPERQGPAMYTYQKCSHQKLNAHGQQVKSGTSQVMRSTAAAVKHACGARHAGTRYLRLHCLASRP
jgi:hypothetical protein